MDRPKILVVGQAPSRRAGRRRVLDGRSGRRLEQIAGVGDLRGSARCVNLLGRYHGKNGKGDCFPRGDASRAARLMRFGKARVVVLLGKNVYRAFMDGATFSVGACPPRRAEYFRWFVIWKGGRWVDAVVVPHPSGVNRWWNDVGNRARAEKFLREVFA